ncbi:MAG: HEAT repeat domain-containing protein [Anaerolineales bacterium]|nr:HEAT repeat domain-containing protein [Anaerolineales bacterium]
MSLETCLATFAGGDEAGAEAAAKELAELAGEHPDQVLAALQPLLTDPQADQRWWALRTLAAVDHPGETFRSQVSSWLAQALADPDASVRQCAALGLRLHPEPAAIGALMHALGDTDQLAASLAADALAAIGSPAVPDLLEVLRIGSPSVRLRAVRALAEIRDPRAIPGLYAALDEDSALLEYWASLGLERMGVGMLLFNPG